MTDSSTALKLPATTSGVTLSAVEALGHAELFTRDQVAYLIHLAYLSGARTRTLLDDAEMVATFAEHVTPTNARQRRIAKRLAEMEAGAVRQLSQPQFWPASMPGGWPLPPPIPDDDQQWPEVDGWPCPPPELRS